MEDAVDLRRNESNEFVANMTALNALAGQLWTVGTHGKLFLSAFGVFLHCICTPSSFSVESLYTIISSKCDVGVASVYLHQGSDSKNTTHTGHILMRAFISWWRSICLVKWTGRRLKCETCRQQFGVALGKWDQRLLVLRWLRVLVDGVIHDVEL